MEKEIFKDIEGYEGLYKVSNIGNIISNYKIRLLCKRENGYLQISLSKKGKVKNFLVHRLVAIAFCENNKNKKEVNHINGIKSDNKFENLEWVTSSENTIHAYKTGLQHSVGVKGDKNHFSKLNESQVVEIKKLIKQKTIKLKDIANAYKVSADAISDIKRGKRWGHI